MNRPRYFLFLGLFGIFTVTAGTAGYMALEDWSFLDSIYMTIITMSTVGYREMGPISDAGMVFTMILIVLGVAFFFYSGGLLIQFMVEGRIRKVFGRRRLDKNISKLKNHYIICGYGRIGRVLCRHLDQGPFDMVIIERNHDAVPMLDEKGFLYIRGEATDEDNLIKAGIHKAKGLVAALGTDTDNVFVVLTARQLNPNLFIMARANEHGSDKKLMAAGSNKVVSPHDIGARRMANGILRPTVTDFLELAQSARGDEINMEEIPVSSESCLAGVTLADSNIRKDFNLIVVAIKKSDGTMQFNPSFDTSICKNDTVIAVGEKEMLASLEKLLNPAGL